MTELQELKQTRSCHTPDERQAYRELVKEGVPKLAAAKMVMQFVLAPEERDADVQELIEQYCG